MKTQLLKITSLIIFSSAFFACEEEKVKPETPENQNAAETQAIVKFKTEIDNATFKLFDGQLKELNNGKLSGLNHRFSGLFSNKQDAARVAEDWGTCALVTIKENADDSWTITFDFGDGCMDDGKFIQGLVAFTGYETDSSGTVEVKFENFFETVSNEEVEAPKLLNGYYKAAYEVSLSNDYDYREAFDAAITADYANGGQEILNATGELLGSAAGITITKYNFDGATLEGDIFSGLTIEPLFYDFSCSDAFIYTRGIEEYNFNDQSATVDFGDGACDNTVTIKTDDLTIIADLDETEG